MDSKTPLPSVNNAAPIPCWFMSNPFSAGMVYDQLAEADFEYVVGMDIGHGESLIALFCKSTGKVELLKLNAAHDTKIPSYIRFGEEKTAIGKQAKKRPNFIQHFKVPPCRWDEEKAGHSYFRLMRGFIRALWQQALELHDELRETFQKDRNKIMLVVGCPADALWTDAYAVQRYRQLVQAATACHHVSILPESTAAIMSVIHSADGLKEGAQLRLDRGLAVVDAGSSTLDFTYVVLGKTLITRSRRLGGSDLDRQMLALILERNGISEDRIPREQYADILVELRQAKEQFYPDRDSLPPRSIPIWGRNSDGTGNPQLTSGLFLQYTVDDEFMKQVLTREDIEVEGSFLKKSWLEMAGQFIADCRSLIGQDGNGRLLCDHVLVTGGTSFVTELTDTVKTVFGADRVIPSRDPSSSVAKGLAHAKRLDIKGHALLKSYQDSVTATADSAYEGLLEDLCWYVADVACEIARDVCLRLSQTPGKKKVSLMMEQITQAAVNDPRLRGPIYNAKVQDLFQRNFLTGYDNLRETANGISASIYGTNLQGQAPAIPPLTQEELLAISARLNLKGFVTNAMLDPIVSESVFTLIQYLALYAAMVLLDLGQLIPGLIAGALYFLMCIQGVKQGIRKIVMKFPLLSFSNHKLQKYAAGLDDDADRKTTVYKMTQDTLADIHRSVRKKEKLEAQEGRKLPDPRPLYGEFTSCLAAQAEAILGKLLFLVYDNRPDTGSN